MNETELRKKLQSQIAFLDDKIKKMETTSAGFSWWRLLSVIIGIIISSFGFSATAGLGWLSLLISFTAFTVLVIFHNRLKNKILKYNVWKKIKQQHLAVMDIDWEKLPADIKQNLDEHPFAIDLDIVGKYSLQRLIDHCSSIDSSKLLLKWLLEQHPDPNEIKQRQNIVRELVSLNLFRDKLQLKSILLKSENRGQWHAGLVLHWLHNSIELVKTQKLFMALGSLAIINLLLLLLNLGGWLPGIWKGTVIIYLFIFFSNDRHIKHLLSETISLESELNRLFSLLHMIETFNFGNKKHMVKFCEHFQNQAEKPSAHLKQVKKLLGTAGFKMNPVLWFLINLIFPLDYLTAIRWENYKKKLQHILPMWLQKWHELEAMMSLANFAHLNPSYVFPELLSIKEEHNVLMAKQLGHPLLTAPQRVVNDFNFEQIGNIVIITGSNMAGKSTFLKTLGLNLALTYAGGPVCASHLNTIIFKLFACIKISDSVTDGVSYFYAEVKRLKSLLNTIRSSETLPIFFMIDEIFKGTNNRERLIGSQAYVEALSHENGIGLVSTHDLELVKLADNNNLIHNYHFREEIKEGKMIFDYKIHPGPCPTTNALKIMELEGLPVKTDHKKGGESGDGEN